MDGLTLLGVEKEKLKKNAPYIGGGVGALLGALLMTFTGKHTHSRRFFGLGGRAMLLGKHMPRLAKIGVGVAAGAAAGAGVGYAVKKKA